jgi:hypothetical protein
MSQRSLARPSRETIARFLDGQRDQPFPDPGLTLRAQEASFLRERASSNGGAPS